MLQIWGLSGIGEIVAGDDLATTIGDAAERAEGGLKSGDIVVVTSKIISKAEGRFVTADDREDAITAETVRVVASRTNPATGSTTRIVENRLGIVQAAAGVDASNTPEGTILLLPVDPDCARASAATWVCSSATRSVAPGATVRSTRRSDPRGSRSSRTYAVPPTPRAVPSS
jgi:coenzyme F420-0:L-glutamate ligase/coenzyme F420-1:gamma-L-glutamate ligase